MSQITLGIYSYPNAAKSAVYGLEEAFQFANLACQEQGLETRFAPRVLTEATAPSGFQVLLLPPAIDSEFYLNPSQEVLQWLQNLHQQGTVLASACAGAFILAGTNLVQGRTLTTHWGLAERFAQQFPNQPLDINAILVDHGDLMSTGGMMSWLDLALELIARYASPSVMRQVGKMLVVDTAPRQQRYYRQFNPDLHHGDTAIVQLQQWLNLHHAEPFSLQSLADKAAMTERTLQRRFLKATGHNPNQYLQRLRVQRACDLLETTPLPFETIASQVGYGDASACRKVFIKLMGLTPSAFRRRFSRQPT
ncbi:GlxA family transcriptional regulator [Ferrimonas marina]|uniref:Transcriptional regulator GlxA family, contains an amidase domain and an AraC-type DNA-binding HTH domain n=1 Tax=Ferrimonas marina TaxID=299255 RepID=A0A1M5YVR1_9GAMM|nr:helix-turn-helix domain-containing protein [Ferrimonas marina]SHI16166.1 Transcriptional regulator GlxA family, contains an amidase domain and an AraC-type DNA-binding HTH domain [Ferrimonas marina]